MLTRDQIDQFHRDGFLVIRNLFKGRELGLLQDAASRVASEGIANEGDYYKYRTRPDGGTTYFRSEKMWDRDPIFQAVTVNPELLECIGQCYGHPFLPINDSFVCKIPEGDVPIAWHQDPPCSHPDCLETFEVPNFDTDIYLDRSTIDNGCVWAIPDHHLVGHVDLSQYSDEELFKNRLATPLEMEAGDVLFHAISAPHGSMGNTSTTWRSIFYVHYAPREVKEHCYPRWAETKHGFDAEGREFVRGMLDKRKTLGFDGLDGNHIRWNDDGFYFDGEPTTQPRHWRTLIDGISQEEKILMRQLKAGSMNN